MTRARGVGQKGRRAMRAAFLVTTSIGAAGCGATTTVNPPFVDCPENQPGTGGDCDEAGASCTYSDGCGSDVIATCSDDLT